VDALRNEFGEVLEASLDAIRSDLSMVPGRLSKTRSICPGLSMSHS